MGGGAGFAFAGFIEMIRAQAETFDDRMIAISVQRPVTLIIYMTTGWRERERV